MKAKPVKSKNIEPNKLKKSTKSTQKAVDSSLAVPASDSSNVLDASVDTSSTPNDADSADVADEASVTANAPMLPTAEQLGISISTGNSGALSATVGDTVNFPITVSWSVNGSTILVVPTSSANAKGILQVGMSQESSRSVKDGKEMAQITFNYKLVMQDTGDLNIPAMRFEIPTPMGQSLDLRSDSVPIHVDAPVNVVPFIAGGAVGICVLLAALWRLRRRAQARAKVTADNAFENALREKMIVLKQRVTVADSREWLLELEGICKEYALHRFGASVCGVQETPDVDAQKSSAGNVNLESLQKADKLDGWDSLLEEFAHARYGGGKRDSFENRETWKVAMKLMGVSEEE